MTAFPPLNIVLHQPEIPQNAGNVGRTCVALGAKLWLVRPLGFRVDAKQLRRAGLDYWPHLDWEVVDDWVQLRSRLDPARFWLFTKSATRLYTSAEYSPGDVLVFGAETTGLPDSVRNEFPDTQWLRIPIGPHVRCLNLSNAVAVAAYEAIRQWS